jgi:tetratricopeptide (TPR) repeat protein
MKKNFQATRRTECFPNKERASIPTPNKTILPILAQKSAVWILVLIASSILNSTVCGSAREQQASSPSASALAWQEHFEAAQAAQKNQDYVAAEREYRSVLQLKPDFAEVHMNLGLILHLQGRREEAMGEFRKALTLKPTLAGANFFLGVNYCQLGDGKRAIAYLKAAAHSEPNRVDIYSWLATAQEMAGDIAAEIVTLQKALALQPQNIDLLYLLGHAYERMGKDEVVALEKSAPASARAEQLLGESYSASSEWPSAVLRFQNALTASAETSGVHVEMGEVLLRQGKLKLAAEEFEAELKSYPQSLRALVRRGEVRLIEGNVDGALQDWAQALETDASRTELILGLRETGLGDAAFEQLPEALRVKIESIVPEIRQRDDAASHLTFAFLATQQGYLSIAAEELSQVHSKMPLNSTEGSCTETTVRRLLDLERFTQAKDCAVRILHAGSAPALRFQVARALFESGDYQDALYTLSKLPAPMRASPEAAFWRARAYEKLATAAYLHLYQADGNSYRMHQLLGDLAAARNDDSKAIEEYQAAIATKPILPNLHYSLGHIYWKDLKVPETRVEFEEELKINPRHPGALNELGDTYLLEHQAEKALPYLKQAVALEPHNPDFHRDMGTAYSDLRQYELAASEFQQALAGDHDGSIHYKLGRAYQAMGQKDKAAQEFALSTAMNEAAHRKLERQTDRLNQIDQWTRE